MSRRQYGFLIGFLIVWLWVSVGFLLTLAAVVAGLIGYWAGRVVDGDVDLDEWAHRWHRAADHPNTHAR